MPAHASHRASPPERDPRDPATPGTLRPSGRLGSGVLSQPVQPPPPMPSHPAISSGLSDQSRDLNDDALDDDGDLAPTEPQLPSMPKLPRVKKPDYLTVATAFSEFMLAQDWTHDTALGSLPIMRRMRLFSALAPTYLQVVQATGRMQL